MTPQTVIDIGTETVMVAIKIAAPALLATMAMGFLVSIFQAATQINEQTLSFIPKVIAMTVALVIAGPWILQTMMFFTTTILKSLPTVTN
ncbi:MAG: flagellar biosynthesis protein FliQ [Bdellovibrionota bacterium]